ncbi:MAG: hydrolase [Mariprofundales bacterium]
MNTAANEIRLECGCPPHYPDWHNCDIDLGGTLMQQAAVPYFFHMPIGFEAKLFRQHDAIQRMDLHEKWPGFVLSQSGMFRGTILCPLQEESSPLRSLVRLPNPFQLSCRIIHGDIGQIKPAVREMQSALLDEGKMPKALYLAYLTCPICQQRRGGMRIMILRHWKKSDTLQARLKKQRKQQA